MFIKCNSLLLHRLINPLFKIRIVFLTRSDIFDCQWLKRFRSKEPTTLTRQRTELLAGTVRNKETGKRRYMKSSCRWATIRFHFDLPPSIVSCDCMWRSHTAPPDEDWCTLGKARHMSLTCSSLVPGDRNTGQRTAVLQLWLLNSFTDQTDVPFITPHHPPHHPPRSFA